LAQRSLYSDNEVAACCSCFSRSIVALRSSDSLAVLSVAWDLGILGPFGGRPYGRLLDGRGKLGNAQPQPHHLDSPLPRACVLHQCTIPPRWNDNLHD
jgi:hypothetical protein